MKPDNAITAGVDLDICHTAFDMALAAIGGPSSVRYIVTRSAEVRGHGFLPKQPYGSALELVWSHDYELDEWSVEKRVFDADGALIESKTFWSRGV